ncbi:MAG: nucleotide exchange factor GrpE [archaeon]
MHNNNKHNENIEDKNSKNSKDNKNIDENHEKLVEEEKRLLEDQKNLTEEYINHLKRLQAEFENYQKRTDAEKIELKKCSVIPLLQKLIEILDNFELALNHKEQENKEKEDEFTKGIILIYKQFQKLLQDYNIKQIESLNQEFDPYVHEAIAHVEGEENIVIEEVQKGYMFYDKIIRPAKVKVGNGKLGDKNG